MNDINKFLDFNSKQNIISQLKYIGEKEFDFFSQAVNKTENDLKNIINESEKISSKLNDELSNYADENNGIPNPKDLDIYEEIFDNYYDHNLYSEYLNSLGEMKIIYLFKNLEINMKLLIQTAYPKVKTKNFYQWENMDLFFKNIDIKLSEVNGYIESLELRKVNNNIKHTEVISDEIKKINEFKNLNFFNAQSLDLFHARVKIKVIDFLKDLSEKIIEELYEFDEIRIEKISDEFAHRMDKKSLETFIKRLKEKYN